jgi:hypothetical protein
VEALRELLELPVNAAAVNFIAATTVLPAVAA